MDEKWAEVFKNPTLQQLIREAMANNYDVTIAAQRVLEQQDQLGMSRLHHSTLALGFLCLCPTSSLTMLFFELLDERDARDFLPRTCLFWLPNTPVAP